MVAYIDEFKDRFRVGPIRRMLAASLDCGFITPRGYRMFRSRPVSRMAARHEAPARGILEIHADSFMAVYGYRKTHAQLLARGWDPAEIGRDQVMNVMRESGIRGVRRGGTPVTTKPAKGAGGRPDLVERGFEAEAPNRPHVADITYVRMANGSFGHTAFAADVFARRIVGWACATTMDTRELPLQALEQGDIMGRLAWRHGRSRAPFRPWRAVHQPRVHHQGRGIRHASLDRHGRRLVRQRHGRERRRRVQDRARLATQALPGFEGPGIGDVPVGLVVELEASAPVLGLQDTGTDRNRVLCKPSGASRSTIRAEQKSGHISPVCMLNRVIGFSHLELPLFEIERPIIVELRSNGMKFIRKTSSASCTLVHSPPSYSSWYPSASNPMLSCTTQASIEAPLIENNETIGSIPRA